MLELMKGLTRKEVHDYQSVDSTMFEDNEKVPESREEIVKLLGERIDNLFDLRCPVEDIVHRDRTEMHRKILTERETEERRAAQELLGLTTARSNPSIGPISNLDQIEDSNFSDTESECSEALESTDILASGDKARPNHETIHGSDIEITPTIKAEEAGPLARLEGAHTISDDHAVDDDDNVPSSQSSIASIASQQGDTQAFGITNERPTRGRTTSWVMSVRAPSELTVKELLVYAVHLLRYTLAENPRHQIEIDLLRLRLSRWGEAVEIYRNKSNPPRMEEHDTGVRMVKAGNALTEINRRVEKEHTTAFSTEPIYQVKSQKSQGFDKISRLKLRKRRQYLSQRRQYLFERQQRDKSDLLSLEAHVVIESITNGRQSVFCRESETVWTLEWRNHRDMINDCTSLIDGLDALFPETMIHQIQLAEDEVQETDREDLRILRSIAYRQDLLLAEVINVSHWGRGPFPLSEARVKEIESKLPKLDSEARERLKDNSLSIPTINRPASLAISPSSVRMWDFVQEYRSMNKG